MRDKSEHRRLDSIPLPNTVVEALSDVPKQECVSHSVKLDENGKKGRETETGPELTSVNHAFYIGKLIPETKGGKVKRLLGWGKSEERIYNPEFIKGSLEYLFAHIKEGEKARVMVCRSLSEIINGPEDVEGAIPTEDEISLIKRIAKKEFGKSDDSLDVVDLETQPHHKQLFEALRSAKPGDRADIERVLSEENKEPLSETSSLHIARQLFKAMGESEELVDRFKNAMPTRLQEDEESAGRYYALAEVAIRLGDILNGCYIHGGAERQAIYDGIIIQILKGEDGKYKDVEALKPLFPILKNHRFETLHLNDKKNYHQLKKVQSTARYRLLVWTALAASAVGGIFGAGRIYEGKKREEKEALVQKKVQEDLKGVTFRFESKWDVPKNENTNVFKRVMNNAKTHLMARYDINEEIYEQLEPFFKSFMLKKLGVWSFIHEDGFALIDVIDEFVLENEIFFKQKGIEVDMPYKKLWEKIKSFKGELVNENIITKKPDWNIVERGIPTWLMDPIGVFYSGAFFNERFEFSIYQDTRFGKKYLVARDLYSEIPTYTSKQARLGLWQFEYAMRKRAIVPLRRQLNAILNEPNMSASQVRYCDNETYPNSPSVTNGFGGAEYTSPKTGVIMDVIGTKGFDETRQWTECVLAATPGDKELTHKRGQEIVKEVAAVYGGLSSHAHNNISGE